MSGTSQRDIQKTLREANPDEGVWRDLDFRSIGDARQSTMNAVATTGAPVVAAASPNFGTSKSFYINWAAGTVSGAYWQWIAPHSLANRTRTSGTSWVYCSSLRVITYLRKAGSVDTGILPVLKLYVRGDNEAQSDYILGAFKIWNSTTKKYAAATSLPDTTTTNPLECCFDFTGVLVNGSSTRYLKPGDGCMFEFYPPTHDNDAIEMHRGLLIQGRANISMTELERRLN